jgi:hypothetical protein
MNLYRVTCNAVGKSWITPEPSHVGTDDVLTKLRKQPKLCPELYDDLVEHGENDIEVELLSSNDSGLKIAKLERLNIKMLGDISYTSKPILTKMYRL